MKETKDWIPNNFPKFKIKDKEIEEYLLEHYNEELEDIFQFLPTKAEIIHRTNGEQET